MEVHLLCCCCCYLKFSLRREVRKEAKIKVSIKRRQIWRHRVTDVIWEGLTELRERSSKRQDPVKIVQKPGIQSKQHVSKSLNHQGFQSRICRLEQNRQLSKKWGIYLWTNVKQQQNVLLIKQKYITVGRISYH